MLSLPLVSFFLLLSFLIWSSSHQTFYPHLPLSQWSTNVIFFFLAICMISSSFFFPQRWEWNTPVERRCEPTFVVHHSTRIPINYRDSLSRQEVFVWNLFISSQWEKKKNEALSPIYIRRKWRSKLINIKYKNECEYRCLHVYYYWEFLCLSARNDRTTFEETNRQKREYKQTNNTQIIADRKPNVF